MARDPKYYEKWALEQSRAGGLRLTRGLRELIRILSEQRQPTSLAKLEAVPELGGHYDASTIYRMLARLLDQGVVRRIGLHERAAYYILRAPGMHAHFLICRLCGKVQEVDIDCPVREMDQLIEKKTGFQNLEHDLSFYGVCSRCRT